MWELDDLRPLVTIFNRAYPPNQQATAALVAELARDLATSWRVRVVCCGPPGIPSGPDGGVQVERGPAPRAAVRTRRVQAIEYVMALAWSLWHAFRCPRNSVALVWTDPPLMETFVGLLLVLRGVRYVQLLQDWHLPLVERRGGPFGRGAAKVWWAIQRFVFERATHLVAISGDTQRALAARGLQRDVEVIENWSPGEILARPAAQRVALDAAPIVVQYSGNIGVACDLDAFAKALDQLAVPERFAFVFRGSGRRAALLDGLTTRFPNVFRAQRVPDDELAAALAACDAHLVLMPSDCYGVVYPSKVYASMAAARPVIVSAPRASVIHELVASVGCGLTAPAEDPTALADVLNRFADLCTHEPERVTAMAARGLAYSREAGTCEGAAARWHRLLSTVST